MLYPYLKYVEKIMTMLSKNGLIIIECTVKTAIIAFTVHSMIIRPVIFCLLRRVALPCFLPGKRYSALRQNQPMQNTADAEEARQPDYRIS